MRDPARQPGMGRAGAERVVVGLAARLSARGHAVRSPARRGRSTPSSTPGGSRCPSAAARRSASSSGPRAQAAFVRALPPARRPRAQREGDRDRRRRGRLARGPRRPPVLATHHGAARARPRPPPRGCWRAPPTRSSCVSEDVLPTFAPVVPRVIHNGVAAAAARAGAPGDEPLVLFVGRLEPVKNPQRFLRRRRAACDERALRGRRRRPLRARARGARAGDVTFTGRPRRRARADRRAPTLLLVSSDSEGQSIAVLEALAAGHAGGLDAGRRA